jgi:Phytanoyl-CoA dioxygenase (PhyH)
MSPAARLSPVGAAARLLRNDDMALLGIERTARLGRALSARRYRASLEGRRRDLKRHLAELRREREAAGRGAAPAIEMRDGWARDGSRSLPHLERLIEEMSSVIEQRSGRPRDFHGKPFLFDILPERAWDRYPSILDFVTTPDVLEPVSRHCGFAPCLSGDTPPGVRLMESTTAHDPQPAGPWRSSQLWHLDYHFAPTVYVIVAIREIGPEDGPLHFIGEAASRRVAEARRYGRRGSSYRISDAQLAGIVDRSEWLTFTGPAGSVLFIDSSRCFHFGSRNPRNPRYQLQYTYVSPVRNDFGDLVRPQATYPLRAEDPLSRRLALDRAEAAEVV